MATILQTLTYTTAAIGAGSYSDLNLTILANIADLVKVKVVPSVIGAANNTKVEIFKTNSFASTGLIYGTDNFLGSLVDPIENISSVYTERNEGFVAKYEDSDGTSKLHIRVSNNGLVARTFTITIKYQIVHNDYINVLDYGALGDGTTDDATAINAALTAAIAGQTVFFPGNSGRTYIIGSLLTVPTDYITIDGRAKIKAKAGVDFNLLLTASGRTGVTLQNLEFDVNGSNRSSVQTDKFNGIAFPLTTDCSIVNVTVRNTLGTAGSATAISASSATRLIIRGCRGVALGTSAIANPSDFIFVRGDDCVIEGCTVNGATDTGYVLEGCNRSIISGCVAANCTSLAAISNDTSDDKYGNSINGLTGSSPYVGSSGGLLAVTCSASGHLLQSSISNVTITVATGAGGLGAGIQVYHSSTGRIKYLTINGVSINIGAATAVLAQGILVDNCDYIQINDAFIRNDTTAGANCIRIKGASLACKVTGGFLIGGAYSILTGDSAAVVIKDVNCADADDYGIASSGTSVIQVSDCTITGASLINGLYAYDTSSLTASVNSVVGGQAKDAGATLVSDLWQAYTPTFASDLGNAATTFSGAVTVTECRFMVVNKKVTIKANCSATLNAVTPTYFTITAPTGLTPSGDNSWGGGVALADGSAVLAGKIRFLQTGALFRIHKQSWYGSPSNAVTFGSTNAVQWQFTAEYEIA